MPKPIRLNKVLKELNISLQRAVDFLQENNVEIEARPTSKIDHDVYNLLISKFDKDRAQREASEDVVINKLEQERKEQREAREKEDARRDEERKAAEEKARLEAEEARAQKELEVKARMQAEEERILALKKREEEEKAASEAKKKAEQAEKARATKVEEDASKEAVEPSTIQNKEAEESSPKPVDNKMEEEEKVIRAKSKRLSGIKQVGKIDLSATKKREPSKKKKKSKETTSTTNKSSIAKELDQPVVKKTTPSESKPSTPIDKAVENVDAKTKTEATKTEEAKTEGSEAKTTEEVKTNYKKLEGLKFTGKKIDLTQFKKKKKEDDGKPKAKRKRIRQNVKSDDKKPRTGGGGRGGSRGGSRGGNNRGGYNKPAPKDVSELTEEQVQKQIKETLEKLTKKGGKSRGAKHRRDKRQSRREQEEIEQQLQDEETKIKVTEFVTVNELASLMDVGITEVISACMTLGVMVTMNQRLDANTIDLVADEFGFETEYIDSDLDATVDDVADENPEDLKPRAPIVTVMGHVDHGKTSLLDYIRSENVIAGESGGITQHIGAYNVELQNGQDIAFLDTPGHEAFTAMRARGAQVTDIAIIVVAADDQLMPQTKEAISHAQAAGVPMIFAINKIDLPAANPEKVKEQLANMNLLVEDWGGKIQSQEISAKTGQNVDLLLEKILLEAELLELKANPDTIASGTVVEASLDKGRGYVSTIIVQNGTLRVGDYVLAGSTHGKIRAMLDERGKPVKKAGPSVPVTVLGLDGAPTAGDKFQVYEDEKEAKNIGSRRGQLQREQSIRTQKHLTLDEIGRRIALGDFQELNVILKGDVDGSVEALTDSLQRLSTDEIHVNILHRGVGQITESDVLLATASDAIIIGFNVRPNGTARDIADKEEIEIRTYSIIYDAINDVKEAMEGMLSPDLKEEVLGNVEVRETFKISKVGTIAGCMVLDGKIKRNANVRIIRDGVVLHDGELASLKRYKDDVKEVNKGYECGLNIKGFNDIKSGDIIEAYEVKEIAKKL